jgi:hypothetical protein
MEGMGTLFFEHGSQTKPPHDRQLCLSRAACASVFEVLAQVKSDAQQALELIVKAWIRKQQVKDL